MKNVKKIDVHFNEDDRAQRLLDVFKNIDGQINVTYVNSTEHVVAWHKHNIQTDYWICLKGSLKVGLASEDESGKKIEWEYLSDKNFKVLEIKPGIYHGYKALEPGTILMYFLNKKYNVDDEFRKSVGYFNEDWKTKDK